jgi:hypothetical protein
MPNIILTDDELQEIDQLLARFDPEINPQTALFLEQLTSEAQTVLCTWVREAQRAG